MARQFITYELWNPITNTIFYVGKGNDHRDRLSEHLRDYHKGRIYNPQKNAILHEIIKAGLIPVQKIVLKTNDELEAFSYETTLIRQYGRLNLNTGPLVNLTDGGEGMSGFTNYADRSGKNNSFYGKNHTVEAKAAMSKWKQEHYAGSGNPFYNKKHTKKSRLLISQNSARRGKQPHNKDVKGQFGWFTNGTETKFLKLTEAPDNWMRGRNINGQT